jgi:hypothetical protein
MMLVILCLDFGFLACMTALIGYLFGADAAVVFVALVLSAMFASMEISMIKDGY